MKICVQGAALDTGNMGVSALAVGSVRAVLHGFPEAEVFFLNYEKAPTTYSIALAEREVAVPLVNMRFSWRFWLRNNIARLMAETLVARLIPFKKLRRAFIRRNPWLEHLEQTDLVAAISGGDSFSDIYGLERLLYVSLPQILALWAGKRLILLPQTLGPFKSRFAKAMAKYIMKRAEVVYSRDYEGVTLGREMLGRKEEVRSQKSEVRSDKPESRNPKPESRIPIFKSRTPKPDTRHPFPQIRFCYDVGFVVDPMPPEAGVRIEGLGIRGEELGVRSPLGSATRRGESQALGFPNPESRVPSPGPLVGLNVSGLLFMGGYSRNNMFGLKVEYDKFIYHLIDFLIQQKNADVLLVPHVFGQLGESDPPACARTYEALKEKYPGKIGWVRGSYNQSEIKYIIGQCDFFVGSRMHACIAAVSQCVPAVAIAYSDKFIGVMETIGIEANVVDLRKMNEDEIFSVIARAYEHRADVRQQLERTMPKVKDTVLRLFEDMETPDSALPSPSTVRRVPVGV